MLELVHALIVAGKARVSEHGFRELREDGINLVDLVGSIESASVVEEYPNYHKGPCLLLLHRMSSGQAVDALWGIAKDQPNEVTLVTAYRPDPRRWSDDFLKRKDR